MDDSQNYDDSLFSMLKDCRTLPAFLDKVFGFLNRRTDFYCIANNPRSPVGLPEGWAENYVKYAFHKWKPKPAEEKLIVPEVIHETEVETTLIENVIDTTCHLDILPSRRKNEFTISDSYNGAVHDNYSWAQTIKEIDITVKLPENTVSKDLLVTICPQSLHVKLKTGTVLLEGELCHKCKHVDGIWSLDKAKLAIHLEKASEVWWECLLIGEPKLDVSKIDCSRPFDELSEEAQAKIEELTWNQERKRLGLPTTEEIQMQETLKKAWDAEGSPFTGPFNPNIVKYQ